MPLAFLGHHGLGHKTFENSVKESVANLGPRYCQKVNVKTGTAKYFDCVAKTPDYYNRLNRCIDAWLTEKSYRTRDDSSRIGHLESNLKTIRNDFVDALNGLDRRVQEIIDFSILMKRVENLQNELEDVRHKLYSDFSSIGKDETYKKSWKLIKQDYRKYQVICVLSLKMLKI